MPNVNVRTGSVVDHPEKSHLEWLTSLVLPHLGVMPSLALGELGDPRLITDSLHTSVC